MLLFCSPSYVPSNNIPNFSKFRFLARLRSKRNIYTDFKINSEKKVFNASLNLEVNFSNSSSGYLHIAFANDCRHSEGNLFIGVCQCFAKCL